jgi:hypothetical protein
LEEPRSSQIRVFAWPRGLIHDVKPAAAITRDIRAEAEVVLAKFRAWSLCRFLPTERLSRYRSSFSTLKAKWRPHHGSEEG